METTPCVIGIDVSKHELVIAVHPSEEQWISPVEPDALDRLVTRLQTRAPHLIVLEATGGYERPLVAACAAAGLPVAVVNPRQVRAFAQALGRTAKTDAIDATVLALFGARVQPAVRPTPPPTPRRSPRSSPAAASCSRCSAPSETGSRRRRRGRSRATCATTFAGSSGASPMSTPT
jgi:uncharacterized protein (DUF2336 family)